MLPKGLPQELEEQEQYSRPLGGRWCGESGFCQLGKWGHPSSPVFSRHTHRSAAHYVTGGRAAVFFPSGCTIGETATRLRPFSALLLLSALLLQTCCTLSNHVAGENSPRCLYIVANLLKTKRRIERVFLSPRVRTVAVASSPPSESPPVSGSADLRPHVVFETVRTDKIPENILATPLVENTVQFFELSKRPSPVPRDPCFALRQILVQIKPFITGLLGCFPTQRQRQGRHLFPSPAQEIVIFEI